MPVSIRLSSSIQEEWSIHLGGGGIALGMLDRMELEKTLIPIQPGDVMVMYSNGVVEAGERP